MNIAKRFLSASLMVLFAASAFASYTYDPATHLLSANDGSGWVFTVTESAGKLTLTGVSAKGVSGTVDLTDCGDYTVTEASGFVAHKNPFYGDKVLTSFIAPDLAGVGAYFFEGANSLTTVQLNASFSPTAAGVFMNCSALENLYPTTFASGEPGAGAFQNVGSSFAGEPHIDLVFPSITKFGNQGVFNGAKSVRSISAPNLTSIGNRVMFTGSGIETLNLPKLNSIRADIGTDLCKGCVRLTNFVFAAALNQFGLSNAFQGCTALEEVTLDYPNMGVIPENTFEGCTALAKIDVLKSPTTVATGAFANIAPSAVLYFEGDVPTFAEGAICAKDGEANNMRAVIKVLNGKKNQTWLDAVSAIPEGYAEKPDYPGAETFGVIASTVNGKVEYTWVVNVNPVITRKWVYDAADPDNRTLFDGECWKFKVTEDGNKGLTIVGVLGGTGDLDFTEVESDTDGYKVVAIADYGGSTTHYKSFFSDAGAKVGTFIAPDMIRVGRYAFYNAEVKSVRISSAATSIGYRAFYENRGLANFAPTELPNLETLGDGAFVNCGTTGSPRSHDFVFAKLGTLSSDVFRSAYLLHGISATNVSSVGASAFSVAERLVSVELGAVTAVGASAFSGIAGGAVIRFTQPCLPEFGDGAVSSKDANNRVRVFAFGAETSEGWKAAIAPNAAQFETDKSRADYPGEFKDATGKCRTLGLLNTPSGATARYSWLISYGVKHGLMLILR